MFFLSSPFLWSSFLLTLRTPFQSASSKSQSGVSLTKKQRPRLGGVLIGIRGGRGVCLPVLQILTLLQTKTSCFSHPFSDLACENCTRFANPRVKPIYRYCLSILSNIWHRMVLFIYSWKEKYLCGSLEKHTQFHSIMSKVYTLFPTNTAQKHTLWGSKCITVVPT